ncbi:dTDP-4-dehydrorhamnose reductase [Flammeovirga yaeyamensis]|uniref:dTDP-4-dehydrorhamnose reductase n=1 Tax=Flammeovirga yaeyamensis TaxID=367791 RepID=A0AAX1N7W3_9BACT|nr:dTDP-4-dehydrorhamnose reductase [Flammeovirga yaeyamensis]MBB3699808.1 dTDP-4-dehydrorhamnose reductase [Flammeovirga yaeyamensis]NMF36623.1 dTDP-4-dehydrorhamnose reductase [Flammeovirga yaeyamensis]QWG02330.1 dTDP-4-dehydrorhamnose reductase [Flammeovirga yaeyamensis]
MKHILVTGANGQLGSELQFLSKNHNDFNFTFVDVDDLDITDQNKVIQYFAQGKFDVCINCAAYTAVDKAESDQELAFKVNVCGPENLAIACDKNNTTLFHVSTDFVFEGDSSTAYSENMQTSPLGVYGHTKLKGEQVIQQVLKKYYILRTAWLYSSYGNNFVKTMLRLGRERGELGVIVDQIGTPTYARDLAKAILLLINDNQECYGVYHFSNEGVASWYDFAKTIFMMKNIEVNVNPIPTSAYPTPAKRPSFSLLDKSKIKTTFNITIPYWQESLLNCLKLID